MDHDELAREIEQVLDTVEIDDEIHEVIHEIMVETESQVEIIELDDDEHFEHEYDELVEIEVIVDEIDETDSLVEMVEINYETKHDDDEMVEYELWNDEMLDDEDEVVITQWCEIDEMQSRMCTDYIWMRDIFETIMWMQDDEIDETAENIIEIEHHDDMHRLDDVVEMVQIDDKFLFRIMKCVNNDVSMWANEKVEKVEKTCPIKRICGKLTYLKTPKMLMIKRIVLGVLGVIFVVIGICNGGMGDVLDKAVKICTQCIGLG